MALTWVNRGIPVVPCSRTDKGAMVPGFGKAATADEMAPFGDPEQVSRWWSSGRFARAHVGLLTGRTTPTAPATLGRGLVVVDLDMPKPGTEPLTGRWAGCAGGTDVLELLMREAGADWPETYTVMTPSGGLHLYYLQPENGPLIGCATGEGERAPHIGPLVDVRGVGGYVIAAGSYSAAQGRPYTRESPADLLPQQVPGWLLELLRPAVVAAPVRQQVPRPVVCGTSRADRYAAAALMGETGKVSGAPEGERNRALFAAARRLAELAPTAPAVLSETTTQDALLGSAREAGIGEQEALRTIRSGWSTGSRGAEAGAA
ncbi:bifunctional DNA primase/polymerase [Streptomyces sp. NPDC047737]|uniref:bifunctional DNA primase/polymerase n=1 Tax=Streptomyces sp. NPDC047737 TaxID=3155740 RepID=UPI0033F49D3D